VCPAVSMPEGSSTPIPVAEEHPEEISAANERAEEEEHTVGRRGMEKQRRRDLSFAASVQQPFVAGRGEKFAFFRHLFFSPSPEPARSSIPFSRTTFRGFFRGSLCIFASDRRRRRAIENSLPFEIHPSLPRESQTILIENRNSPPPR